jgi:hypothetical protein
MCVLPCGAVLLRGVCEPSCAGRVPLASAVKRAFSVETSASRCVWVI